VNTHTLALLALIFSAVSNGNTAVTLIRHLIAARARWIERKLGVAVLPPEPEPDTIQVSDILEIKLKPKPRR
jgi:hypothetical protein